MSQPCLPDTVAPRRGAGVARLANSQEADGSKSIRRKQEDTPNHADGMRAGAAVVATILWPGGTGLEPSGDNWKLAAQQLYKTWTPALGTTAVFENQDGGGLYILGWDLWGSISIADVYKGLAGRCKAVYYIALWRDQPTLPVGIDTYRAIAVHSPS